MSDAPEFWLSVIALLILGAAASLMESSACRTRYAAYGSTSWGPIQGCMVEKDGKRIPAEAIREVTP